MKKTQKKTAKKTLVVVESPAKAKTIEKYLGKNYMVRASMGHLRDLPKSQFGIDVEHDFAGLGVVEGVGLAAREQVGACQGERGGGRTAGTVGEQSVVAGG